jgi:hypothetical protein
LHLEAGYDTALAYGYSGHYASCTIGDQRTPTTIMAWDGFGICQGDCAVIVDPGEEMTLEVEPWNPEVTVTARFTGAIGGLTHSADLTRLGDGRYRLTAATVPGDWHLVVDAQAPGETGHWGFDVRVRDPVSEALASARARWEATGPARYRFTAELGWDWGSAGRFEVWVDGAQVTEVPPAGTAASPGLHFGGVPWLFDLVESIPPEYRREVVFDPDLGYPSLILAVGPNHEEWTLRVQGLGATDDEPPAVPAANPELPWLSQGKMPRVSVIKEGTVGLVLGTSPDPPGWVVAIHFNGERFPEGGRRLVDPLFPARLPMLWGRQGERLIFFLGPYPADAGQSRLLWVARPADDGLEFLGPADAGPYLNAEVPRLCTPASERTAASPVSLPDADSQLAVLTEWARHLSIFQANHGTAATAAQAEERLTQVCRDLGLSH